MDRQHEFYILSEETIEEAWSELESKGCRLLYSEEESEIKKIIGYLPQGIVATTLLQQCSRISHIGISPLREIDWEAQWAAHSSNYYDGYAHIHLSPYKQEAYPCFSPEIIRLKPGPGFGDLSHPTTRLVLRLMPKHMPKRYILDVGCGSGILSLAAIAMNAESVCSLDIDPQALLHTQMNAHLNEMDAKIHCYSPGDWTTRCSRQGEWVMLLNMIQSEQIIAWESLSFLHPRIKTIIASGILIEDKQSYLELCQSWRWNLKETAEEGDWCGFYFSIG